jgi:hypothetical protein
VVLSFKDDRSRLRKRCGVSGVQPLLAYNVVMNLTGNEQSNERALSRTRAASPWRGRVRVSRAILVVAATVFTGVLAAGCGSGSSGLSVAQPGNAASLESAALGFTDCMRTHGEPNMPEPSFNGGHAALDITPGSGVDPNSPQFTAATQACQHLVSKGGASPGPTITAADQADYLKAVACVRSHGFPGFPDPVFQNNTVTFNKPASKIDTNSAQFKTALMTCQKLIPAGLPDSSGS